MPMEAKDIFEANSKTVRELLSERGLGLYVPPYQRPYGWDADKVSKLVEDTLHGYAMLVGSDESFTFLGTVITIHDINYTTVQPIVRQDVPGKLLTVIDGQQRLTTLLLVCLALHNNIGLAHSKLLKSNKSLAPSEWPAALLWLDGQARRVMEELAATFHERQAFGDSPLYPRMIRSFDDQWSRSAHLAKYESPIANLIAKYIATLGGDKVLEFKPQKRESRIEGEDALVERYIQLSKIFKPIVTGGVRREELEELPTTKEVLAAKPLQQALLNHEFPQEVIDELESVEVSQEYTGLLHLILLAGYLLNRVAVTVVRGKNEDYAFTVFESLNTTGEPLTAYETFKPRVVSAETLAKFEQSESRRCLNVVSDYLSGFKVGDRLQAATSDLLIYFAAAETGKKLSKRLADQRRYLKEEFERYESDKEKRVQFVAHLRDVATFIQHSWEFNDKTPSLANLPVDATTDFVKLCLSYFRELKHTVVLAPLVRFYSVAISASDNERAQKISDFEEAIKAMAAFSVLWRASHRGTANIDQEYREVLTSVSSLTGLPPLARKNRSGNTDSPEPIVDVTKLKQELRARLTHLNHGGMVDRERFVSDASQIPAYQNSRATARFILLAAYHDAIADPVGNGLIVLGKQFSSPCLTYEGYINDRHLSLEHVSPQTSAEGWDKNNYVNRETVHRIGNLVLVQSDANSSLGNRPWSEKRVLYKALGAPSHQEAESILAAASDAGVSLPDSTQQLAQMSSHMPHLTALGAYSQEWSVEFIDERSRRLLGLAWDRLMPWLH
ncbi:DUF262 domain-containing protein [Pseudomonas alliivorans]|uniref:DUF262 domain-containing protein n=1 Tax=Pseudomonas alliivorans TaxID=2810613 RepID=UPI00403A9F9E